MSNTRTVKFLIPGARPQEVDIPGDIDMPTIGQMLVQIHDESFPSENVRTWVVNDTPVESNYRPSDGETLVGIPQNKGGSL